MKDGTMLVVMRFADAAAYHPRSSLTRRCPVCDERVVISPSGERALAEDGCSFRCTRCYTPQPGDNFHAAPGFDDDSREWRASRGKR